MILFTTVLKATTWATEQHASPSEALRTLFACRFLLSGQKLTVSRWYSCFDSTRFANIALFVEPCSTRLLLSWLVLTLPTSFAQLSFSWWKSYNQFCFWTSWWQPKYQNFLIQTLFSLLSIVVAVRWTYRWRYPDHSIRELFPTIRSKGKAYWVSYTPHPPWWQQLIHSMTMFLPSPSLAPDWSFFWSGW